MSNNSDVNIKRYHIIRSVGEECVSDKELYSKINKKETLHCYDGFEPSGRIHIAQGIVRALSVNKLIKAGCYFTFLVADWFAYLNNKLGGKMENITDAGNLMIETWKAAGMNMDCVRFVWSSIEIEKNASAYWKTVMDISKNYTISRIKRCSTIMGRNEGDDMNVSQLLYPCMQCADIFYLKVDICSLGIDQRKVNILAREYADKKGVDKPIILSHHMIMGLKGEDKMSKSNHDSAIFMDDNEAEINRKIKKAFCPMNEVNKNPILEYYKYIVFEYYESGITIKRKEKNGGDVEYKSYITFEADYESGKLHPADIKYNLAKHINNMLQPVRDHFKTNIEAKKLLRKVKRFTITR